MMTKEEKRRLILDLYALPSRYRVPDEVLDMFAKAPEVYVPFKDEQLLPLDLVKASREYRYIPQLTYDQPVLPEGYTTEDISSFIPPYDIPPYIPPREWSRVKSDYSLPPSIFDRYKQEVQELMKPAKLTTKDWLIPLLALGAGVIGGPERSLGYAGLGGLQGYMEGLKVREEAEAEKKKEALEMLNALYGYQWNIEKERAKAQQDAEKLLQEKRIEQAKATKEFYENFDNPEAYPEYREAVETLTGKEYPTREVPTGETYRGLEIPPADIGGRFGEMPFGEVKIPSMPITGREPVPFKREPEKPLDIKEFYDPETELYHWMQFDPETRGYTRDLGISKREPKKPLTYKIESIYDSKTNTKQDWQFFSDGTKVKIGDRYSAGETDAERRKRQAFSEKMAQENLNVRKAELGRRKYTSLEEKGFDEEEYRRKKTVELEIQQEQDGEELVRIFKMDENKGKIEDFLKGETVTINVINKQGIEEKIRINFNVQPPIIQQILKKSLVTVEKLPRSIPKEGFKEQPPPGWIQGK